MALFFLFTVAVVSAAPIRLRAQHAAVVKEGLGAVAEATSSVDIQKLFDKHGDDLITTVRLFWQPADSIANLPFSDATIAKANPSNAAEKGLKNIIYHAVVVLGLGSKTADGKVKRDSVGYVLLQRVTSLEWEGLNKEKYKRHKLDDTQKILSAKLPFYYLLTVKGLFTKLFSYVKAGASAEDKDAKIHEYLNEYNPEKMNCQHFTWDILRALFKDKHRDGSVIEIPVGKEGKVKWTEFKQPDLAQKSEVLFDSFFGGLAHVARVPNIFA